MDTSESTDRFNRTAAHVVLVLLLLLFIDGATAYVQMCIFGGRIPVPASTVKLLLVPVSLAIMIPAWIKRRPGEVRRPVDLAVSAAALTFIAYLLVHMILSSQSPFGSTVLEYNSLYSGFVILLFVTYAAPHLDASYIVRLIVFAVFPLALLAGAQYLLNDPIVPVKSLDGWFRTNAWTHFAKVRAFSLFTSPANCGAFMVFASLAALAVARNAGSRRSIITWCATALVPAAVVLVTMHRHSYIHLAVGAVVLLLWRPISRRPRLVLFLPMIISLVLYAVMLTPLFLGQAHDGLASTSSMQERVYNMHTVFQHVFGGGLERVFFGTGLVQHPELADTFLVLIDNSYLAVMLHTGLIGMLLAVLVLACMWTRLADSARPQAHPLTQAVVSYWIVWPLSMSLEIMFIPYVLTWLLLRMGTPRTGEVIEKRYEMHPTRIAYAGLAIVLFIALTACIGGIAVDQRAAETRVVTRSRMKVLQRLERIYMAGNNRYCNGIDSLMMQYDMHGRDERVLYYKGFAAMDRMAADSIGHSPSTGQPYIVVVDSTGLKYQIRDPGGNDYISSWTNEREFDRASWE